MTPRETANVNTNIHHLNTNDATPHRNQYGPRVCGWLSAKDARQLLL